MDRSRRSSHQAGSPRVLRAARMSAPVTFSPPEYPGDRQVSSHLFDAATLRSSSPPMPPLVPRGPTSRRAAAAPSEATTASPAARPAAAAVGTRRSARKRKQPELLELSPEPSSRKRKATPPSEAFAKKPPPKKKRAPGRLKSDPDDDNKEDNCDCCICMTEPEPQELATINGCEHFFCFECIEKWADRENTCPLCKKRFSKIDRVQKPKRQKGAKPPKSTVKVKTKSQRSELTSSLALEGLFGELGRSGIAFESFFARLGTSRFNTQLARIVVGGSMGPHHGHEAGGPLTRAARAEAASTSSSGAASAGPRSGMRTFARASPETAARLEAAGVPSVRVSSRFADIMFDGDDEDVMFDGDDEDGNASDDEGGFYRFANSIRSMDSSGMRGRTTFSFGVPGMHISPPAPPRSYASNMNDATAGASADNALEIEDSDDDDDVEVVQVRNASAAASRSRGM